MEQIKYSTKGDEHVKFHSINCEIETNGEANVSKYFEPAIIKRDDLKYDVSFRGRPFYGQKLQLPAGHFLSNLKPSKRNEGEFLASECSNEFTYWNFDQQPDLEDNTYQTVNWLNISKALMANVTMDDLKQFN